jgi:glycosyltransferase
LKISIITVTYNSASTIQDTLASVAAQTHTDVEHIVIDGGSTDGTQALVQVHGGRVSRMLSEPDKGIYDAMNKGLRLVTGDYVGFLNGDDTYADPGTLARIAQAAEDNPDALYGDLVYVDPSRTNPLVRFWRAGRFARSRLRFGWMPPHPTLYVRRDLMARIGPFDAVLRIAADYEYMLRLLTLPGIRLTYIPHVLVRMRVGGASNANTRSLMRKSNEDLLALRRHRVGGWPTLFFKNVRKLPQFFSKPRN